MEGYMLYKDVSDGVIKDVDTVKGIVTGYFSIFGNKDSDGDIVMPGAYKRTLKANGPESDKPRILHLYQHDASKPLAKPSVLKEDKTGLYFESTISQTQLGKDVIQLYQDKVLTEHSIGYQIVKRERDDERDEQKLIELKLWEGSTVSWGANMDAVVSTIKAEGVPDKKTWDKLLTMMDALDEALKGNYSDDTARQIEIQFKQLQQVIMSLARRTESAEVTPDLDNSKVDITADWIIKMLNLKNI
jgi:HK97 family phage prohead protease